MTCGAALSMKACYGKALARSKARLAMRKHVGEVIRPYRCQSCGWWHIGHQRLDIAPNARRDDAKTRLTAAFMRQGMLPP